ncbi:DgyrCDS6828 [Dimorphilus gyrociliatus]|uniref:DgyrCDS6828 n=1 Tax=Dimorphilus gyrociliatus TaxID=2664684 RepID=A0A7I8VPC0_9ANNE|nr:DgyrCDS6828 [Dimorphilus gyrociliatus]
MELTENISSEDSQIEKKNYISTRNKRRKDTSQCHTDEEYDAKKSKTTDQNCCTDDESDNSNAEDDEDICIDQTETNKATGMIFMHQLNCCLFPSIDDRVKKSAKVEKEIHNKNTGKSATEDEVYYDKGLLITDAFLVQIMKSRRKRRAVDFRKEKEAIIDSVDDEVESHISFEIDERVKSAIAQKNSNNDGISSKETQSETESNEHLLKCPRFRTDLLKGKSLSKLCTDEFMDNYFFSLSLKYSRQRLIRVKIPVIDNEESSSSTLDISDKKCNENANYNEQNDSKIVKSNAVAAPHKKRKLNDINLDEIRESNSDEDIRPKTRSQKRVHKTHTCPICMREMECDFEYFQYHASECRMY